GKSQFTILPHPAKSNNPADLNAPGASEGLRNIPAAAAFNVPGPFIPTQEMANSLEKPLSREELQAKAAALNK
ncbi:hypothetical protein JOM56_009592, partial [Amanita muscaria]